MVSLHIANFYWRPESSGSVQTLPLTYLRGEDTVKKKKVVWNNQVSMKDHILAFGDNENPGSYQKQKESKQIWQKGRKTIKIKCDWCSLFCVHVVFHGRKSAKNGSVPKKHKDLRPKLSKRADYVFLADLALVTKLSPFLQLTRPICFVKYPRTAAAYAGLKWPQGFLYFRHRLQKIASVRPGPWSKSGIRARIFHVSSLAGRKFPWGECPKTHQIFWSRGNTASFFPQWLYGV